MKKIELRTSSPKKVLINYSNDKYRKAQRLQTKTGKKAGFDQIIEYGPEDVDYEFKKAYEDIFAYERGNGLWAWKPYLILKTLENCNEDDIIFYCDSGACFFRNFKLLKTQDIWITTLPLFEKQFTKAETFKIIKVQRKEYTDTPQRSGTFIAFRKTDNSVKFVKEWLNYCCNVEAIAPPKDNSQEIESFYEHREDQSILSLLSKKYGIKAYSDPSQYGRLPEKYIRENCEMCYYGKEDYRPFILHHRTKDGNKKVRMNQWLCAVLPRKIGLMLIELKS